MPFLKHLILLPDLNISDGTRNMSSFGTRFTNSRMGTDRSGYGGTSRGVSNILVSPLPTSQRCNITTVLECIIHRLSKLSPFKNLFAAHRKRSVFTELDDGDVDRL